MPRRPLLYVIIVISICLVGWTWFDLAAHGIPLAWDARSYFAAARAIASDISPYEYDHSATPVYLYPPLLAMLLSPLATLPIASLIAIWETIVALSILLIVPLLIPLIGWRRAIVGVLFFVPSWQTLYWGQINGFIAVVLLLSIHLIHRKKDIRGGAVLALGILLKITPAVLLVMLVRRQRWRTIVGAMCVIGSIVLASLPWIAPRLWLAGSIVALQSSTGDESWSSLPSILYSILGANGVVPGLLLTLGITGITLWRGGHVDEPLAIAAAILVPVFAARVTWNHHAVMALPALALLWQHKIAARRPIEVAWLVINMLGGLALPATLLVCWVCCLWPSLLRFSTMEALERRNRLFSFHEE